MKAFANSSKFYLCIAATAQSLVAGSGAGRAVAGKDGGGPGVGGVNAGSLRLGEGGGHYRGDGAVCTGEKNIPFMVTNVKLTTYGSEHFWGYHSNSFEGEFKFLKNIRYCPDGGARIYGTLLSPDEYKNEVEEYVVGSPHHDSVLYNIHGYDVNPEASFTYAHDFLHGNGADTGILAIPINWRNSWNMDALGLAALTYRGDRHDAAPQAGRELAAKLGAFESVIPTSVMCHGLGSHVFRVMAQNAGSPVQAFDNAYLVAADARLDLFGTAANPNALTLYHDPSDELDADDELRKDGGYDVVQVATHVHVLWNRGDRALLLREAAQSGGGADVQRALGRCGDLAEELMTLNYFKERVSFHDFSAVARESGDKHSYQFHDAAVNFYAQYGGGKLAAEKEKQADLKTE